MSDLVASLGDPQHRVLRERLAEITVRYPDDVGPVRQPQAITDLTRRVPHSIRLLERWDPSTPSRLRYTCHVYALGLHESDEAMRHRSLRVFPNAAFVRELTETVCSEVDDPREGSYVVYSDAHEVKHSGRFVGGRIQSKWGIGHVWEHAVHEVPIFYGDRVQFFAPIEPRAAVAAYVGFARRIDPSLRFR